MMNQPSSSTSRQICLREDALEAARVLRDAGHVAYFAGGCVRDLLMGLTPTDYDVATDAPPDKVRRLFRNAQEVGAAFGVIIVRLNKSVIEIATFRADGAYLDGRRPSEVRFTTAEEDAKRRDFTINGLFQDPFTDQIIDFVNGQQDIQSRVLRAIGEPAARFDEDYLRMLRAVRFAARFDLTIDTPTADAIRRHASKLAQISPERIAEELRKMLTGPSRTTARLMLVELQLMRVIFRGFPTAPESACAWDLFDRLAPDAHITFGLALAAVTLEYRGSHTRLTALLEKAEVQRAVVTCRKLLRISNEEADEFVGSLRVSQLLQPDAPSVAIMKRFLARPYSGDARKLLEALSQTGFESPRIKWLEKQFASFPPDTIAPPPFVTGDDLIILGLQPGKSFKTILDRIYDLQLEGKLFTKPEAMKNVHALAAELKN